MAIFLLALTGLNACTPNSIALEGNTRTGPSLPFGTPRGPEAIDGLLVGHRLMAAQEFELALSSYQRAASEAGVTAEVLSGMGSANLRLGRLQQARILLEKAVAEHAESPSAWNNLGVVLINLGEPHEAREAFRVAFGLDNGDAELIRQNLILANRIIDEQSAKIPEEADFALVRYGNGSYLLLGIE